MDPRLDHKKARSSCIIRKRSVGKGQGETFLSLPGEMPDKRKNRRIERGLERALLILSLHTT